MFATFLFMVSEVRDTYPVCGMARGPRTFFNDQPTVSSCAIVGLNGGPVVPIQLFAQLCVCLLRKGSVDAGFTRDFIHKDGCIIS